jgi:hypothetical protein
VAIKILKVEGVATTLDHSNGGTMGRDIGGKNNKFNFQKVREGPSINTVTEWKGKKWVDEEDANVTWFHIPKSQKYVNTGGTMVPVEQVVQGAPQYPQFEFHKNAMVWSDKLKKGIVGAYKIRYEKMGPVEAKERMHIRAKQAKAEVAQRKRDEKAAAQAEARRGGSKHANTKAEYRKQALANAAASKA